MTEGASLLASLGLGAAAVAIAMFVLWSLSLRLRDVSIVDVAWGPLFLLLVWIWWATGPGGGARPLLVAILVSVWGLRLAIHLLQRKLREPGEDRRYAAMRERHGTSFRWRSLATVFGLQGAVVLVVASPLLVLQGATAPATWRWTDAIGLVLWIVGFGFETVGDRQLARFKQDPAHRGRVLDSGLWRYTRHPNYFGDATVWWGHWFLCLAAPGAIWTIASPLLMSLLLMKVSGVTLLEKDIGERRPGYRDYVRRTSAFFPLPPRRGGRA